MQLKHYLTFVFQIYTYTVKMSDKHQHLVKKSYKTLCSVQQLGVLGFGHCLIRVRVWFLIIPLRVMIFLIFG